MSGTDPLRRALAATTVAFVAFVAFVAAPAAAIDPSYSGSWFNPPESGSGFNLEIFDDDRALLFWYTYDDNGDPVWLYSEGAIDGETIDFTTYYSDGMVFSDLDEADRANRVWGTVRMTFQDCNHATITYQSTLAGVEHSPVGARTHPVERLVNIASLPCRGAVAGYWQGIHVDPRLNNETGAWVEMRGVLTEDGRMYMNSVASEELFVGTYEVQGPYVEFDYRVCNESGESCFPATASALFGSRDFIRGSSTSAYRGTQPFRLTYRALYDRPTSMETIAGTWTSRDGDEWWTFTITPEGELTGTDSADCRYAGEIEQLDGNFNLFSVSATMVICGYELWEGVVLLGDNVPGDNANLEFWVETTFENGAMSFRMQREP